MGLSKTFIVLFITGFFFQNSVQLDLFGPDQQKVALDYSEHDLTRYPELNGVTRYCNSGGMWALYKNYSFTGDAMCAMWTRPWNYCWDLPAAFSGQVLSAKAISEHQLTLFSNLYFTGNSTILDYRLTTDILVNTVYFKSFVINGGMPITLFEKSYYQGYRNCYFHIDGIGLCRESVEDAFPNGVGSIKLGDCISS